MQKARKISGGGSETERRVRTAGKGDGGCCQRVLGLSLQDLKRDTPLLEHGVSAHLGLQCGSIQLQCSICCQSSMCLSRPGAGLM